MRLHIRVFKERRQPKGRLPAASFPKPLAEDMAGEVFVGKFSTDERGTNEQEASGRDMNELAANIRTTISRSESGVNGKTIPNYSFQFAGEVENATRTLVGSERSYEVEVKRMPLLGSEITEFFKAIEAVIRLRTPA